MAAEAGVAGPGGGALEMARRLRIATECGMQAGVTYTRTLVSST